MMKFILASAAVFTLAAASAMAQDMPADPTAPTPLAPISAPTAIPGYSSSRTVNSVDGNGVETEQTQSYSSGMTGVKATSSWQTLAPDGAEMSASHEERSVAPIGQATTTTTRTTTTTTTPDQ
jgi:hypothetical protein